MDLTESAEPSKREGRKRRLDVFLWSQEEGSTFKRPKLQESVEEVEVTYENILKYNTNAMMVDQLPVQNTLTIKIEGERAEVDESATLVIDEDLFWDAEAGSERNQVGEDIAKTSGETFDADYQILNLVKAPRDIEAVNSSSIDTKIPILSDAGLLVAEAEAQPFKTKKPRMFSKRCPHCNKRLNFKNEVGFKVHLDWHAREDLKKSESAKENVDPMEWTTEADMTPLDLRKLQTSPSLEVPIEQAQEEPTVDINIEETDKDLVFKLQFDGNDQVGVRLWKPYQETLVGASEAQQAEGAQCVRPAWTVITPEIALKALKSFAQDYYRNRETEVPLAQIQEQGQLFNQQTLDYTRMENTPDAAVKDVTKNRLGPDVGNLSTERSQSAKKLHQCAVCGKKLASLRNLKQHCLLHEEKAKQVKCPICGKSFSTRKVAKDHLITHTGEKPFECSFCGRRFGHRSGLRYHNKAHAADKTPFKCSVCSEKFINREILELHLIQHTGDKQYECSVCGLKFLRRESLTKHAAAHESSLTFDCPICQKKFANKRTVQQHLRTHEDGPKKTTV